MTFFVDQQFALGALEALPTQAPNTVVTKGAESTAIKAFGLEKKTQF